MKVSEIQLSDICDHIHEIKSELESNEQNQLEQIMLPAAISYCVGQTGLSKKELDEHEDITIAVLEVVADMWDDRSFIVANDKINPVVDKILAMHSINLLPSVEVE